MDAGQAPREDEHDLDYRFTLANERTYLAWLRTALGLLAGAVALVHVVPKDGEDADHAEKGIGIALALLGISVVLASIRRWQVVQRAMERHENLPISRAPIYLGLAVVALGLAVIVLLAR
jgi:putative membrane protein